MKKLILFLLTISLLAGIVGCKGASEAESVPAPTSGVQTVPTSSATVPTVTGPTEPTDPTDPTDPSEPPVTETPRYQVDWANGHVYAGNLEALELAGETLAVSYGDAYLGQPGLDYSTPEIYTFRDYLIGGQGLQWSPLTWQTAEDAYLLEYLTTNLYSFTLNSDLSGWTILCELAAAAPEDVTAEYEGQFGIAAGDTARAWRISLNPQACWSNGQAITAQTYLYSWQQLLDSRLENGRGADLCSGKMAIAGAADYYAGVAGWDAVGILATDTYELVLITEQSVPQPEFYVPYCLQSAYLVYEPLWESCKQFWDADGNRVESDGEAVTKITTTYATTLNTTVSYGPYCLIRCQEGEGLELERNFVWYGYADGKHLGQYQADAILCQIYSSYGEALEAFRNGQLDRIRLQESDAAAWEDSGLLRYQPETYTTKLTFNTDPEALAQRGHQVLANGDFRRALTLALDRSAFVADSGAWGLLNEMYMAGPGAELAYRDTEQAQWILTQLYGQSDSQGQALMQKAYTQCLADGSYHDEALTLTLSVYRLEESHAQLLNVLQAALDAVCENTGFAGKLTLVLEENPDCYNAMARGQTDLVLTTWGGNSMDPYSILYECYCSDSRLEYGFDPGAVTVQIGIDGAEYTDSLLNWALWCAGLGQAPVSDAGTALLSFQSYSPESRAAVFAQLEYAYLSQCVTLPLYNRGALWLLSEKGDYAVKNARSLVGFGGIRYYTFACSDDTWAEQNG